MLTRLLTACALVFAIVTLTVGSSGCGNQHEPAPSTAELAPVVTATLPEIIPEYAGVDPATGLHVTGTPLVVDVTAYRLRVTGKVAKELSLTYDEIRNLPKQTATPDLLCPGEFQDTATWSGASVQAIIEMAGVQPGAVSLILTGADRYTATITLEDALQPQNFLAYELEGQTLPALHGFPLRAVFPGKYGAYWVKWLLEIEVR